MPTRLRDPGPSEPVGADRDAPRDSLKNSAAYVARQPYARRVAVLILVSTITLTLGDYLFKSIVADTVPPEQLGSFFARTDLTLNLLSLVAQLALVGYMLRRFDLVTALTVLPGAIVLGGIGLTAFAGLWAAIFIKGADGALRYSLHKTSTELLYVPMSGHARALVKGFIDVVAQRGGQAVASVAILTAAALAAPVEVLAGVLTCLATAWLVGAIDLRRHYLDHFRHRLAGGGVVGAEFPELDVASLETLVATLDSPVDDEVIAALDVLAREGKIRLVPGLILYHPSPAVVERALTLFTRSNHASVVAVVDRQLEHSSPRVRAAAIALAYSPR